MAIHRVRPEQGTIANNVDDPRHSAREAIHLVKRRRGEQFVGGASDAEPVSHVRRRLVLGQRIQVVAAGHALCQLAQLITRQQLPQLRLPDQDDLQQFLRVGLEVREQTHLLEDLGRQVLGFIDHDNHATSSGVGAQQVLVEDIDQILAALGRGVGHSNADLLADGQQELQGGHARIQDQRDFRVLRGLCEQ